MIVRCFLFLTVIFLGAAVMVSGGQKCCDHLKVEIKSSMELATPDKVQFRAGEKISFLVAMTNESSVEEWITIGQQWRYIRPQLKRDGKLIPYKADVQQLLREGSPVYSPLVTSTLKPYTPSVTDRLNLEEWYDPPEPGHYILSIERLWMEQALISNQLEFDVVP